MKFKLLILLILYSISYSACKSQIEIIEPIRIENEFEEDHHRIKTVQAKIVDSDNKPITLAAIKLTLDDCNCINSYSDFDGVFSVTFCSEQIKYDSFLEIIYQGYSKKVIFLRNLSSGDIIKLEKGDTIITEEEYRNFYEGIRKCTR